MTLPAAGGVGEWVENDPPPSMRPHRRYTPHFDRQMVNLPIARRLAAAIKKHSWSRNRWIRTLRRDGGQLIRQVYKDGSKRIKTIKPRRASIRAEREQTMTELALATAYFVDYDPNAPYLFEVHASTEQLAEAIGQLHRYAPGYDGDNGQYRHGRVSYDPVLGALEDWAAAGLIVLVSEYDADRKSVV